VRRRHVAVDVDALCQRLAHVVLVANACARRFTTRLQRDSFKDGMEWYAESANCGRSQVRTRDAKDSRRHVRPAVRSSPCLQRR
jgi:hypothetical protein